MRARKLVSKSHVDSRGRFSRLYDSNYTKLCDANIEQVNISKNPKLHTLRGMHYQISGPPENKFIKVINGTVQLVVSNAHCVRKKTDIQNDYFTMSDNSEEMLFVPTGLATGWISLSENVTILYLMTSRFEDCTYSGFRYDDHFAGILWEEVPKIISDKDLSWPILQ